MKNEINRREFMKLSSTLTGVLALTTLLDPSKMYAQEKPLRVGFVGVGDRGSYHLDVALGIPGIEVPAICDIKDFIRMCEEEELDCIICSTSWKWHAPVCVSAMKNGKNCVSEVPIVITLDEAWEIIETAENTGKWATIGLEQALIESSYAMALLNLIRNGVMGEVIHAESGYVHDLRLVKFDPEREPWRLQHSIDRNGNLYPDHPMNKIMTMMNVNHGDRFDYLVSMSSKSVMLNQYAQQYYGENNIYATHQMKQGDYNVTLLHTVNGKTVTLNFDTNTPHPRGIFRIQGTKGVFLSSRGLGAKIYIDGRSPEEHRWEDAQPYFEEYAHPLVKNYNPLPRKETLRGHGGGGRKTTPLTWHLLVGALRENRQPFFDVYDSVTSSAISPLSEMSVANKSQPIDFPDFTKGQWKTRPPLDFKKV
jgi:predicted dehydrogenase